MGLNAAIAAVDPRALALEQLRRHSAALNSLVGACLTGAWTIWIDDSSWFADGPVALQFDASRQFEICWQEFDDLSISWNTIDTGVKPTMWVEDVSWTPWKHLARSSNQGESITSVAATGEVVTSTRRRQPPSCPAKRIADNWTVVRHDQTRSPHLQRARRERPARLERFWSCVSGCQTAPVVWGLQGRMWIGSLVPRARDGARSSLCGSGSTSTLRERYINAMSEEIRQSELRNDNASIMRRVAEGESFVVTVNGRPVADVLPHRRDAGRRRFVPVSEVAKALAAEPVMDSTAWRNDLAAADEVFGPDEPTDPFDRERN